MAFKINKIVIIYIVDSHNSLYLFSECLTIDLIIIYFLQNSPNFLRKSSKLFWSISTHPTPPLIFQTHPQQFLQPLSKNHPTSASLAGYYFKETSKIQDPLSTSPGFEKVDAMDTWRKKLDAQHKELGTRRIEPDTRCKELKSENRIQKRANSS